jgi:hypothetical protein
MPPPLSLVQNWFKRFEASLDGGNVNHRIKMGAPAVKPRPLPGRFIALLLASRFFPADAIISAHTNGP